MFSPECQYIHYTAAYGDAKAATMRSSAPKFGLPHRRLALRRIPRKLRSNRLVATTVSDGGSVTATEQPVIAAGGADPAWKTEQLPATVTKSNGPSDVARDPTVNCEGPVTGPMSVSRK